jgi:serine/threonine kinase 16
MYAAAYGQNPFEKSVNDMGGYIALAILNGHYTFPENKEEEDPYSEEFKELIKFLLVIDPKDRPDIESVSDQIMNIFRNFFFLLTFVKIGNSKT